MTFEPASSVAMVTLLDPVGNRWAAKVRACALAAIMGALANGCARPGQPSGGPPDFIPPMVQSTWPEPFETIEPTRDPVRIVYSERISERPTQGTLTAAVLVSPFTGETRVKHTRSGLEVEVLGGFKPGLVYRVRVFPTVKDMFNNPMRGPFELVFSTGAPFETNVLAGMVKDRITLEPAGDIRVEARDPSIQDGPVYLARSDSAGVFALRYLPAGTYELSLYQDLNRNTEPDFSELQGEAAPQTLGTQAEAADTVILRDVRLLRPDTTAARVTQVEALDSLNIRVAFDDYMDAEGSLEDVQVRIVDSVQAPAGDTAGGAIPDTAQGGAADTAQAAGPPQEVTEFAVEALLWPRQRDSLQAIADSIAVEEERRATLDSLMAVADTLRRVLDSMQAVGDTLGGDSVGGQLERIETRVENLEAPPEEEEEEAQLPAEPEPILPKQEFFVRMAENLPENRLLIIKISGVTNLNGVPGGGGESSFEWVPPEEEEPDTAALLPDSAAIPDTAQILPDTGQVPPDTAAVPDTVGVPPDTTAVPDTVGVPPDTTVVPDAVGVPPDTTVFPPSGAVARLPDGGAVPPGAAAVSETPLWWLQRHPP